MPPASRGTAYSPITCTIISRVLPRLSKSRKTTCCQAPGVSLPPAEGNGEGMLHEGGAHVDETRSCVSVR
jgi:hypothetical protein